MIQIHNTHWDISQRPRCSPCACSLHLKAKWEPIAPCTAHIVDCFMEPSPAFYPSLSFVPTFTPSIKKPWQPCLGLLGCLPILQMPLPHLPSSPPRSISSPCKDFLCLALLSLSSNGITSATEFKHFVCYPHNTNCGNLSGASKGNHGANFLQQITLPNHATLDMELDQVGAFLAASIVMAEEDGADKMSAATLVTLTYL